MHHMFPPALPSQPLPQQPNPVSTVVSHQSTAPVNNTPVNVVITSSDKIPTPGSSAPTTSLPAVAIPPQHRLGGVRTTPAPATPEPSGPASNQHHYQINIEKPTTQT